MKRYKHNLSHYNITTVDMGKLYPIGCQEVLPGDSFSHATSLLVRTPALSKPVMHPVQVRVHHFYVPNRLVWSGWEDFITGEDATPPPTITPNGPVNAKLYSYMGASGQGVALNAMPIRAFNKVYNEYYRDQDLCVERSEDDISIPKIAWEKDIFTASRPWPQKGDAVTIPIGGTAPITTDSTVRSPETGIVPSTGNGFGFTGLQDAGANIVADLQEATSADVRAVREAFALQRYQEARARYGSKYVDYLRYCGVNPSDSRLQRPEYLGGGKQTITFSEVVRTEGAAGTALGQLGGHGIAAMRTNRYQRYFEEHGHVISCLSIRPKSVYIRNTPKNFIKTTKEDYFQKELQDIGQQELYNKEVYSQHADPDGIYGQAYR